MYAAVGNETGSVYFMGKDPAEVFRTLQKGYPGLKHENNSPGRKRAHSKTIYPEPLRIRRLF